ncbi:MAG: cysteine synthase family protein [bacterium]
MNMIYNNILETIGNTKLLKLSKLSEKYENNIYAKIESGNPFGSVKDRIALNMINNALESNLINKESTIIEPTSGNTGIALAAICLYYNIKCIIIMPENMSKERIAIIKAYHAEIILTDKSLGMSGAIAKAEELAKEYKNSFIPSQFENSNNPLAHYNTTAKEIYDEVNLEYFFSGIGTGGTISGCGRYFKEQNDNIKVIGIEPSASAILNNKPKGPHMIQGIGAGFKPNTLSLEFVDEVLMVSNEEAFDAMNEVNKEEVAFIGISSGAAFSGVVQYIKKNNLKDKNIVLVFPDSLVKYLSIGE